MPILIKASYNETQSAATERQKRTSRREGKKGRVKVKREERQQLVKDDF